MVESIGIDGVLGSRDGAEQPDIGGVTRPEVQGRLGGDELGKLFFQRFPFGRVPDRRRGPVDATLSAERSASTAASISAGLRASPR